MRPAIPRRWLWAGLALALGLAFGPRVVGAHAILENATPAPNAELAEPPAAIDMWFTEPLEPALSGARVLNATGDEMPAGAVVFDPADRFHLTLPIDPLPPGVYTVVWQTYSQLDGHAGLGSFPITVLNPDGSRPAGAPSAVVVGRGELPSAGEALARWVTLLGAMTLFGVALFQRVVVTGQATDGLAQAARDRALEMTWLGALALAVGHWAPILLQAAQLDGPAQWTPLVLGTRPAALGLARQFLAACVLLAAFRLPQPPFGRGRERWLHAGVVAYLVGVVFLLGMAVFQGQGVVAGLALALAALGGLLLEQVRREAQAWEAMLFFGGLVLLGFSASSHAAAGPGSAWAILADYAHLTAAAAWLGGLVMLPGLLSRAEGWPLARRFSSVAAVAMGGLLFTGVFNSVVQIPDLPALVGTLYGRVLLIKLALTGLVLGLAALNHHLTRARPASMLGRQVDLELGLALALMASVAVLVQTPTPRPAGAPPEAVVLPFTTTLAVDDLYAQLQVAPFEAGRNRFWVHLYREPGAAVGEVQLVRLVFEYLDAAVGESSVELTAAGNDTYAAEGAYLSQAGPWALSVYVRRRGRDDALTRLEVDVPFATPASPGDPFDSPLAASPLFLLAGGLGVAGLFLIALSGPLTVRPPPWPRLAGVGLLLGAGAVAVMGALAVPVDPLASPVPATAASVAEGRALYVAHCATCHGGAGQGDGPEAAGLRPPPADLRVRLAPGIHSDRQIFEWLSAGAADGAMPAFGDVLTEAERWHLVNFLRTLSPAP